MNKELIIANLFKQSWAEARKLYKKIKVPMYSEKDWSPIDERKRTISEVQHTWLVTLPQTGHFSFVESPGLQLKIILREAV